MIATLFQSPCAWMCFFGATSASGARLLKLQRFQVELVADCLNVVDSIEP